MPTKIDNKSEECIEGKLYDHINQNGITKTEIELINGKEVVKVCDICGAILLDNTDGLIEKYGKGFNLRISRLIQDKKYKIDFYQYRGDYAKPVYTKLEISPEDDVLIVKLPTEVHICNPQFIFIEFFEKIVIYRNKIYISI